jgi:hypothetical protein
VSDAFRGDQVIERHDEMSGGGPGRQEELYMVVAGHAEFTVAGGLDSIRADPTFPPAE